MELTKKTTILLQPGLHERLTRLAERRSTSVGELIRSACERQYGMGASDERLTAVDSLGQLSLPVSSPGEMKHETGHAAVTGSAIDLRSVVDDRRVTGSDRRTVTAAAAGPQAERRAKHADRRSGVGDRRSGGMVLIDTGVLMYAAGEAHPNKKPALAALNRVASGEVDGVVDGEVLQEVLHRYRTLGRWDEGLEVYDLARTLFPVVLPVDGAVLDRGRAILATHDGLMARDAVHAAVVLHHDLDGICSFDPDFDQVPGLVRLEPVA